MSSSITKLIEVLENRLKYCTCYRLDPFMPCESCIHNQVALEWYKEKLEKEKKVSNYQKALDDYVKQIPMMSKENKVEEVVPEPDHAKMIYYLENDVKYCDCTYVGNHEMCERCTHNREALKWHKEQLEKKSKSRSTVVISQPGLIQMPEPFIYLTEVVGLSKESARVIVRLIDDAKELQSREKVEKQVNCYTEEETELELEWIDDVELEKLREDIFKGKIPNSYIDVSSRESLQHSPKDIKCTHCFGLGYVNCEWSKARTDCPKCNDPGKSVDCPRSDTGYHQWVFITTIPGDGMKCQKCGKVVTN